MKEILQQQLILMKEIRKSEPDGVITEICINQHHNKLQKSRTERTCRCPNNTETRSTEQAKDQNSIDNKIQQQ